MVGKQGFGRSGYLGLGKVGQIGRQGLGRQGLGRQIGWVRQVDRLGQGQVGRVRQDQGQGQSQGQSQSRGQVVRVRLELGRQEGRQVNWLVRQGGRQVRQEGQIDRVRQVGLDRQSRLGQGQSQATKVDRQLGLGLGLELGFRLEQGRVGQVRVWYGRVGQGKIGQDRIGRYVGQVRRGQVGRYGQVCTVTHVFC